MAEPRMEALVLIAGAGAWLTALMNVRERGAISDRRPASPNQVLCASEERLPISCGDLKRLGCGDAGYTDAPAVGRRNCTAKFAECSQHPWPLSKHRTM